MLNREGISVARCIVERRMRAEGLRGVLAAPNMFDSDAGTRVVSIRSRMLGPNGHQQP